MNKLDFNQFVPKLGTWANYMKSVFESEEMFNLYQEFKQCREVITPKSSVLFRAFELCPKDNLKLIIMGMDSYPSKYFKTGELQATGLAFDCSNSPNDKLQPSLYSFWDGLRNEFQQEMPYEKNLSFLAEQGVLLVNRSLNCKLNKPGSFMGKWDFMWKYFFEEIIFNYYSGVPVILLGKDASELRKYIFEMKNPVFQLTHPSFAARNQALWETNNVFTKANKLIVEQFGQGTEIIWDKKIYDEIKELPF